MQFEFFKMLKKSKWLSWFSLAPFIITPIVVVFNGEMLQGVGILAFFGSMWLGVVLGGTIARVITARFLTASESFGEGLTAAFCAFGFLFVPALVGSWTNTYLNTDIKMYSLAAHFLWACLGGGIFFVASYTNSGK